MKPWFIPLTFLATAVVLLFATRGVINLLDDQVQRRTEYFLAIKTEDLDVESFEDHFKANYIPYSDPEAFRQWAVCDREDMLGLKNKIQEILQEHPDGMLFHYDTPEKVWKNLGGRRGYAIIDDGSIVWEQALAKS